MKTVIESPASPLFPPAANTLYVRAGSLGPPPSFYYELQQKMPAEPIDGEPAPDLVQTLANGNASMTAEQWEAWTDQEDDPYILACVAKNLGLVIA